MIEIVEEIVNLGMAHRSVPASIVFFGVTLTDEALSALFRAILEKADEFPRIESFGIGRCRLSRGNVAEIARTVPKLSIDNLDLEYIDFESNEEEDECVDMMANLIMRANHIPIRFFGVTLHEEILPGAGLGMKNMYEKVKRAQEVAKHNKKAEAMTLAKWCHKSLLDAGMELDFYLRTPPLIVYNMTQDRKKQRLY